MRRRCLVLLAAVLATVLAVVFTATPAAATGAQPRVVSDRPASWTPHVLDGTVYAIAVVGTEVVVGGDFTRVATADRSTTLSRHGLFAFRLGTGEISSSFTPTPDGTVRALAAGPDNTVYAGGDFSTVGGAGHRGIAQLAVPSGTPIAAFTSPGVDGGDVTAVAVHGSALYVGGSFTGVDGTARPALAKLSGTSGALDTNFNAGLAQQRSGRLRLEKLAITNDGATLAAAGTFTRAGGADRNQLALLSAASGAARNWYTTAYVPDCHAGYNTYLRGVDFAPDGSYLVVVTTGHQAGDKAMCNSAARFDTGGTGAHDAVWVNRTGGNSLFAVAVTGAAVYVGGHEQWLDNPHGDKSAGPGAVSRPGIGAIDPTTGKALAWNPTRSRGVGVQSMVTYPAGSGYPGGLLVGSDTDQLGHEYHGRIGAFPL
ncbi:PKD domain containing protein [Actinocatenispora rupis]|uniref:PKD domain-containing protein n=1 Tax=Actinocatenispora rupis TaxID=519421 RepID=A0A8J3IZ94_9ACTN|nr:PKD domain containing protein [Actinocatenispora rupis]GID11333.1 hypothetical protein Aru02nite_22220 [Actinocatenispora rupis]